MKSLPLIKIDSLKITFPFSQVHIVDNKLGQEYKRLFEHSGEVETRVNQETGALEEFVNLQNHVVDETFGIKSRIAIGTQVHGDQINRVVYVQVNAKMLREKYDEGITFDNWKMLYNHIINLQVVYIDERTWMHGLVSDIDFCYDFVATAAELVSFSNRLKTLVLPHMVKFLYGQWSQKTNVGLQFRERSKGTPAKPFIKFYHKGLELLYNSVDFYNKFLKGNGTDYSCVSRLEINLKNSDHKKYHNLTHIKSFIDLMEITQKEKEDLIFSATPKYVSLLFKSANNGDLPPMDQYTIWLFKQLMRQGYGKSAFISGLELFGDKQQKHRMRKKLFKLFSEIEDQTTLTENTKIDGIFKQLKILE
tara:strand:- start:2489 stop:3577 length:1089 start_codon:yes stop_codon:yes gene_type:complete